MCIPQVTVCWIHPRRASLYLPSSPAVCLVWTGSANKLSGTNIPTVPMPLKIRLVHRCGVERKERYSARPGMEAFPGPTVHHVGRTGDVVRVHACRVHWRRREKRRYACPGGCVYVRHPVLSHFYLSAHMHLKHPCTDLLAPLLTNI